MSRPKVAAVRATPDSIVDDIKRLMHLAEYPKYLPQDKITHLKINISWQKYYPACSTTPWQLDGVIKTMLDDGYKKENIHGAHNRTVVVSAKTGEVNNKQKQIVVDKYGLENIHIYEKQHKWIRYRPQGEMIALNDVYPEGIYIPELLLDTNVIHLPTMKTHVFTTITCSMKNAFGGLLNENRHWAHSVIHEVLVDLLTIQKEIHTGIFAVVDGTFAGDGPGPRCMDIHVKDWMLAGADQVAVDAIAAKMMGLDPLSIKFIRLAHEKGLGVGDPNEIDVVGDDISQVNFKFDGFKDTFASKGQKMIYHGVFKPIEKLLLRTVIAPWSYVASMVYHDVYWYNLHGRKRVKEAMRTKWGELFQKY